MKILLLRQKAEGRRQRAGVRNTSWVQETLCIMSFNFKLLVMSYREQFIWKRAIQISINCYRLTEKFPKSELYGLTSQIRRASVSVPSNIAEGYGRKSKNEYIQFLHIALGSLRELDTQLIIAKEVKLTTAESFEPILEEVDRMQGILVSTIQKLKS
jgi:four helix bundle protein